MKVGAWIGVGTGIYYGAMLIVFSLAYWYSAHCIQGTSICSLSLQGGSLYNAVDIVAVFFAVTMSSYFFT